MSKNGIELDILLKAKTVDQKIKEIQQRFDETKIYINNIDIKDSAITKLAKNINTKMSSKKFYVGEDLDVKSAAITKLARSINTKMSPKKFYIGETLDVKSTAITKLVNSINTKMSSKKFYIGEDLGVKSDAITGLVTSINTKLASKKFYIKKVDLSEAEIVGGGSLSGKINTAIGKKGHAININTAQLEKDIKGAVNRALGNKVTVGSAKKASVSTESGSGDSSSKSESKSESKQNNASKKQLSDVEKMAKDAEAELKRVQSAVSKIQKTASSTSLFKGNAFSGKVFDSLVDKLEKADAAIKKVGEDGAVSFNKAVAAVDNEIVAINKMIATAENMPIAQQAMAARSISGKISSGTNPITDMETLTTLSVMMSEIQDKIVDATIELKNFGNTDSFRRISSEISVLIGDYQEAISSAKSLKKAKESAASASASVSSGNQQTQIDVQIEKVRQLEKEIVALQALWKKSAGNISNSKNYGSIESEFDGIMSEYDNVADNDDAAVQDEVVAALNRRIAAVTNLINEENALSAAVQKEAAAAKVATSSEESKAKQPASYSRAVKMSSQINKYLDANGSAKNNINTKELYGDVAGDMSKLQAAINGSNMSKSISLTNEELDAMDRRYKTLRNDVDRFNAGGKTMFTSMSSVLKTFSGWFLVSSAFAQITMRARELVENVKNIDAAMTELKKVTDETDTTYSKFLDNATNISSEVGVTLTDTISATANFSKLGYNIEDAQELAETALIYENVGDDIDSIDDASQSITSTLKAFFNDTEDASNVADNANHIIDTFNEVGNNYAISSGGIGDALQRSAAALAAGGNTLEESIGMITATNEIQQDPERVGNAMKTLSMYLRSAKVEAEQAGIETDGMASSTAKLRDTILSLTGKKVDIMADETTLKSTYQVYKEIAAVWDDMTDIDQAALLESLGGKRNANVTASLIENFSTAEDAAKTAANSTGSATKENEKYLDSVEGKLSVLTASFEKLSNDLLGSTVFKAVVSGITDIVDVADKLCDVFGALPVLISTVVTSLKTFRMIKDGAFSKKNENRAEVIDYYDNTGFAKSFNSMKSRVTGKEYRSYSERIGNSRETVEQGREQDTAVQRHKNENVGSIFGFTEKDVTSYSRTINKDIKSTYSKIAKSISAGSNKISSAVQKTKDSLKVTTSMIKDDFSGLLHPIQTAKDKKAQQAAAAEAYNRRMQEYVNDQKTATAAWAGAFNNKQAKKQRQTEISNAFRSADYRKLYQTLMMGGIGIDTSSFRSRTDVENTILASLGLKGFDVESYLNKKYFGNANGPNGNRASRRSNGRTSVNTELSTGRVVGEYVNSIRAAYSSEVEEAINDVNKSISDTNKSSGITNMYNPLSKDRMRDAQDKRRNKAWSKALSEQNFILRDQAPDNAGNVEKEISSVNDKILALPAPDGLFDGASEGAKELNKNTALVAVGTENAGKSGQEAGAKMKAGFFSAKAAALGLSATVASLGVLMKEAFQSFIFGLMIEAIYKVVDAITSYRENIAEASKETFDTKLADYEDIKEQADSVSDIVDKYKELGGNKFDNVSDEAENTTELISLQEELNDLIGSRAGEVDLVNGKYQNQLDLLNQIKEKENEKSIKSADDTISAGVTSAEDDYKANNKGGLTKQSAGSITIPGDYYENLEKSGNKNAFQILTKSKKSRYYTDNTQNAEPNINYLQFDESGIDSNIDLVNELEDELDILEANGIDSSDEIYRQIQSKISSLKEDMSDLYSTADEQIDNVVNGETLSDPFDSASESLVEYRKKLIKAATASDYLKTALETGLIDKGDIKNSVDTILQSLYPDEYSETITPKKQTNAIAKKLVNPTGKTDLSSKEKKENKKKAKAWKKDLQEAFDDSDDIEIAYDLVVTEGGTYKNIDDLKEGVSKQRKYNKSDAGIAETARKTITDLWSNDDYKSDINSLKKKAQETKITADDIEDLAAQSEDLADVLDQDGISAEYLAYIFQKEFDTGERGAGIASITENAISLNKELDGLSDKLDDAAKAKDKYDAAMEGGNSGDEFSDLTDAYTTTMTAAREGRTGEGSTDFWAGAEYLLGEDKLKELKYNVDDIVEALKNLGPAFESGVGSGEALIQKFQSLADESGDIYNNGEKIASISTDENGFSTIEIDEDKFDDAAEMLGTSEEAFSEWANAAKESGSLVTYSVNDVYNNLRKKGSVVDTKGTGLNVFGGKKIVDTKSLGWDNQEIEQLKDKMLSADDSFAFLNFNDKDSAIQSLKDIGVYKKNKKGKYKLNTKKLNALLESLGYGSDEVQSLYDMIQDDTGLSDKEIKNAVKDYKSLSKEGAEGEDAVNSLKDSIDDIKDEGDVDIDVNINYSSSGATDPDDPYSIMPDYEALYDIDEKYRRSPVSYNTLMSAAMSELETGYSGWSSKYEAIQSAISASMEKADPSQYNEEYAQSIQDQIDLANRYIGYYEDIGVPEDDPTLQNLKATLANSEQALTEYRQSVYEASRSIIEDSISQIQDDTFVSEENRKDKLVSMYTELYNSLSQEREQALADGYDENSEYVRSISNEMLEQLQNVEKANEDAFSSYQSYAENEISNVQNNPFGDSVSNEGTLISMYTDLYNSIADERARALAAGADADSEYIRNLSNEMQQALYDIEQVREDAFDGYISTLSNSIKGLEFNRHDGQSADSIVAVYQQMIAETEAEISRMRANGASENNSYIQELISQEYEYMEAIREAEKTVQEERVAYAKHLSTMQSTVVSRGYDPRSMISYYQNEQRALNEEIAALAAQGYTETDEEIYSLREQIAELTSSIMDSYAEWWDTQDSIKQREGTILEYYHADAKTMQAYYNSMVEFEKQKEAALRAEGYGEYSSEVQDAINSQWSYAQQAQEAFTESLQDAIDIYDLYFKEMEVAKAPFEEYVRLINEKRALINDALAELRSLGYSEQSDEIVSYKEELLDLIEEVETRASDSISMISSQIEHTLYMLDRHYSSSAGLDSSIEMLTSEQDQIHEIVQELREMGYNEDSDVIMENEEKWWELWDEKIQRYQDALDEILRISDHTVSMVFDRKDYNYSEYVTEYKRMQEEIHQTAETYRNMGVLENSEEIEDLQDQWLEYEDKILEVYEDLVTKAQDSLSSMKSAYDAFFEGAEDYAQYGLLSYDSYEAILELGPEYMAYLSEEGSQLKINKDSMEDLIAAKSHALAVNTALNYVEQLSEAIMFGQIDKLNQLTIGTLEAADATESLVYANLQLLKSSMTDEQYEAAFNNLRKYFELAEEATGNISDSLNTDSILSLDDAADVLDDFIGYVEDMIQEEYDAMEDALDKQLDKYQDIVDKKKEALELAKDEADYEKSVADQIKDIAKLQNQIDQLSLDDSKEAAAKRKKLEEELEDAQYELADDQAEHALSSIEDQLDRDEDALSEETDNAKEALEEEIESAEKLHQKAIDTILEYGESGLQTLLDEVLDWNYKAGNSLERNIKDNWSDILQLVERYGSLVGAIEAVRNDSLRETVYDVVSDMDGTSNGYSSSSTGSSSSYYSQNSEYSDILDSMIKNSVEWWISKNTGTGKTTTEYANENLSIAQKFNNATGLNAYRSSGGRWYLSGSDEALYSNQEIGEYVRAQMIDNNAKMVNASESTIAELEEKNKQLASALSNYTGGTVQQVGGTWYYNGKKLCDPDEEITFHKGGVVGSSTLKQDEVMAKLQNGEIVLNDNQQKGLFKLVDIASYLSDKLGSTLKGSLSLGTTDKSAIADIATNTPTNSIQSSINFAPQINVSISGGTEDAASAKDYAKQIADMTLGNLKDAFRQRGITKSLAKA